jgi:hypothetical protein
VSLFFGAISCAGFLAVAAFPVYTEERIHSAFAVLAFVTGCLYIFLQSIVSIQIREESVVCLWRVLTAVCCIASLSAFALLYTTVCLSPPYVSTLPPDCLYVVWPGRDDEVWSGYWHPCMPDYSYNVAASLMEWIAAVCFVVYFYSYHVVFKRVVYTLEVTLSNEASG